MRHPKAVAWSRASPFRVAKSVQNLALNGSRPWVLGFSVQSLDGEYRNFVSEDMAVLVSID